MSFDQALQFAPTYVLVFFRVCAMMIFAPLFGSKRIPKRVRVLLAAVMAMAMAGGVETPATLPQSLWALTMGIGGEIVFGLAMGMVLSFVFMATQWAGEMIGQQMGLNMSEVLDPQFGQQGSIIGDMYFMMSLVVFLGVNGHHAMLRGVNESFKSLPLLTVAMDKNLFSMMVGLTHAMTTLALQLAAPMLVTMLVIDVILGFVSKTMPQLNLMTAGMSVRSMIGLLVLIVGISMSSDVIREAMLDSMDTVRAGWNGHFSI